MMVRSMTLNVNSAHIESEHLHNLLEETLAPLEDLRGNSDVLILPDETERGPRLNPNTVDICIKMISKGIAAKMLAGDTFEVLGEEEGKKSLPTIFILNHDKEDIINTTLGQWIMNNLGEGVEVSFSFIVEADDGTFTKNSVSGTLEEIGAMLG